jgi:hypothetical protein
MTKGWHRELAKNAKLVELDRRTSGKKRKLQQDSEFVSEDIWLKENLKESISQYPKLRKFFRDYYDVVEKHRSISQRLRTFSKNKEVKSLIQRYIRFATRFGVLLRLTKSGHLKHEYVIPWGTKFHVRIVDGHFEPAAGGLDMNTPLEYDFESPGLSVGKKLQNQIDSGVGKVVLIEEDEPTSLLSSLESFAYHADGLTYVLHEGAQSYLLCLVGEKVTTNVWRRAGKTVSEFLRENFNRGKAGRPKDLKRYAQTVALRKRPGLLKASLPIEGRDKQKFESLQAYSSRVGKSLRK